MNKKQEKTGKGSGFIRSSGLKPKTKNPRVD